MKLQSAALDRHLNTALLPLYWISGDEPLLLEEAVVAIRTSAQSRGFTDMHSLDAGLSGNLEQAEQLGRNFSLFADKQYIELYTQNAPTEKLTRWVEAFSQNLTKDTLLVVRSPKLTAAQQNSAWYKAVDKAGAHVSIWPIETKDLPAWLQQRAQKQGLKLLPDAALYLANRTEGNLLAANGEIEKLALSAPNSTVNLGTLQNLLEDYARFDVFNLTTAVLKGEGVRAFRILSHLMQDTSEYTLILWALCKELRILINLHQERSHTPLAALYKKYQIWDKRVPQVQAALNRLPLGKCQSLLAEGSQIDLSIKGLLPDQDAKLLLQNWAMQITL